MALICWDKNMNKKLNDKIGFKIFSCDYVYRKQSSFTHHRKKQARLLSLRGRKNQNKSG